LAVRAASVLLISLLATTAHAEPWYRGGYGTNRIANLSITTAGLVLYPLTLSSERDPECQLCGPPNAVDTAVRDALVWSRPEVANNLSDVVSWGMVPALSAGLLSGTLPDTTWANAIDDITPVLESIMVAGWITRGIKIKVARKRPYAYFTNKRGSDDNVSFLSGHASRAFATATAAGVIAHVRGYSAEPYIWVGGMTIAATTAYLRIAADRHYLTDVLVGSALGVAVGLTVPLLMRRPDHDSSATSGRIATIGFARAW
jgi:membrane-associated phospholipid phosphatase